MKETDEVDLSDITANPKEPTQEEIIAAAEEAAFAGKEQKKVKKDVNWRPLLLYIQMKWRRDYIHLKDTLPTINIDFCYHSFPLTPQNIKRGQYRFNK